MVKWKKIAPFVVLLLLTIIIFTGLALYLLEGSVKNPEWLGEGEKGILSPLLKLGPKNTKDYKVTLEVVRGDKVKIPQSRNPIITCVNGRIVEAAVDQKFSKNKYIVGFIQLKEKFGRRIYELDLRITKGPLKGCVVYLRDGFVPPSVADPYFSFFEIPPSIEIEEGPLEFEVINFVK